MFTGIIKATAKIKNVEQKQSGLLVRIGKPSSWKLTHGESVAVQGVCSTVMKKGHSWFEVQYMPETLKKTTAAEFERGDLVNIERSLRLNEMVHGHLVYGHIDSRGRVDEVRRSGSSTEVKISVPKQFMKYIVPKGSITIDGVALSIMDAHDSWFSVALIPYTLQRTSLATLSKGKEVNVETDMFAKYVYRILTH